MPLKGLNKREGDRLVKLRRNFNTQHLEKYINGIIEKIITKYQEVFALEDESLPCRNLIEHEINLKSGKIVSLISSRLAEKHKGFSSAEKEKLLSKGIIRKSQSPFISPL